MNQKLRLALIVAVFFAVPALLTLALIDSDHAQDAQRGLQPGGPIHGRVVGADGNGVGGVEVALLLDPSTPAEAPEQVSASAHSGTDGRFELVAPPVNGRYTLVAGGGTWQRAARSFSFVGLDTSKEFKLRVLPGCELEATFTRADGTPAGAGSYELEGRIRGGWFSFFGEPPVRRQGRLEGGFLHLEGLPPIDAQLGVRFDAGESLELKLDLQPGRMVKQLHL